MEKQYDPRVRETIFWETLPSGLRIGVLPRPGWREATAQAAVRYGGNDLTFVPPGATAPVETPAGIAHFLEHKLFESEDGDAMTRFSALGADSNAYTDKTRTVYYFTATENFREALEVLLNMVQEPWFTPESVAKEQGIIEQEIRMYEDNPEVRSWQNMLEAMYHRHPVRTDIAGTVESIRQINHELLYQCHRTFYHPSNMLLFVAGDLEPQAVIEQVAANVERRGYQPQALIRRVFPDEPGGIAERRREQALVVNQPLYRLSFKERSLGLSGRDLLEQEMLTAVVLDVIAAKASPLYTELYEAGLIDGRFGFDHTGEPDYGHTTFAGPTRNPEELEQRLLAGIAAARDRGLDPADFERAKRKTLGRFLSFLNSTEMIAYVTIDGYFKDISLFEILPVTEALTVEAGNRRLREHLDPDCAVTSVIRPKGA